MQRLALTNTYSVTVELNAGKKTRNEKDTKKKIKNLYLPLTVFIAQRLVRPSKQLKQIIQIEHNIVKNPNWPEADQLAI